MVDKHSQSFFGQSTGITLQSSSKSNPYIFFKCIQKKPDGSWEKPSKGEGKTIKMQLDEIIMILDVLNRKSDSWSSYHNFNKVKTQISVKWEDPNKKKLWINIDKYSKMLNFAQAELLRLLLKHILKEKIEYSTVMSPYDRKTVTPKEKVKFNQKEPLNIPTVQESIEVLGVIESETDKALLIQFNGDKGIWVPKSCIHSDYESVNESAQSFLIDNWLLKKNNIIPA
jgi:hypothetical protein